MPRERMSDDEMLLYGYKAQGMSDEQAAEAFRTYKGRDPLLGDVAVRAEGADVNVRVAGKAEVSHLQQQAQQQFGSNWATEDALDVLDTSVQPAIKLNKTLNELITGVAYETPTAWQRTKNVMEQTLGRGTMLAQRLQQFWRASELEDTSGSIEIDTPAYRGTLPSEGQMMNDKRLAARGLTAIAMPELLYSPQMATTPSPELEANIQSIDDLTSMSLAAKSKDGLDTQSIHWYDKNPIIMDMSKEDYTAEEVLVQQLFGSRDAYDEWLMQQNNAMGKLRMGGFTALITAKEILDDPANYIPGAFFVKGFKRIGQLPDLIGAAGEAKLLGRFSGAAAKLKGKAVWQGEKDLASFIKHHDDLGKKLARAEADLAKNPGNSQLIKRVSTLEKRQQETKLAIENMSTIPEEGAEFRKIQNAKAKAKELKVGGGPKSAAARRAMAYDHASDEQVLSAFKDAGLMYHDTDNWFKTFSDDLAWAVDTIVAKGKGTPVNPKDMASADRLLKKIDQLPENIRQHLDLRGVGKGRAIRLVAQRMDPPHKVTDIVDASDPGQASQRALLGPDDIEEGGDAAFRMTLGADPQDIPIHTTPTPEWRVTGTKAQKKPWAVHVDNEWVREVKPKNVTKLADGTEVLDQGGVVRNHADRVLPGPQPGSWHLRLDNVLSRASMVGNLFRFPMYALRKTGAFEAVRGGTHNFHQSVAASDNWMTDLLKEVGFAKRTTLGGVKYLKGGRESLEKVKAALHLEGEAVDKAVKSMSDAERKVYIQSREWVSDMYEKLGLDRDLAMNKGLPALIPWDDIKSGARPIELLGLPITAEIGTNIMEPVLRRGKDDFMSWFEIINRSGNRKLHMEPAYAKMLKIADDLEKQGGKNAWKANYVRELLRESKGIPSNLDRAMRFELEASGLKVNLEQLPWHTRTSLAFTSLLYHGLLAGNINYMVNNFATAANNIAAKHGPLHMMVGLLKMGTKEGRAMAEASGVARSARGAFTEGSWTKLGQALSQFGGVEASESFARGWALHSALSDMVRRSGKSWDDIVEAGQHQAMLYEAVKAAEFTQHVYGTLGRSPYLTKTIGKAGANFVTQFITFPWRQVEFGMELMKQNPGHLMEFFMYAGVGQRIAAQAGIDVSSSLGLDSMTPDVRQGRAGPMSPGMDFLASTAEFLAAMNSNDPQRVSRASAMMAQKVTGMIPIVSQYAKWGRNVDAMLTGKVKSPSGELQRKVNYSGNQGDWPKWLNIRTVEDAKDMRIREQIISQRNERMFAISKTNDQFIKAMNNGDERRAQQLVQDLARRYGVAYSPNLYVAAKQAEVMSKRFRMMLSNKEFLPPEMWKIFPSEGEVMP